MSLTEAKNGWFIVTGLDRFDEIRRMEDPERWPYGTYLPVKRTGRTKSEYGILLAAPHVLSRVYDKEGNVLHEYGTFDSMLDDGWRVD